MRLRLKFSKTGRLKYIGHLDLLNIFGRALKSAKLPVMYSKGYNPHMLITFAAPLPLGVTSVSEYVDIDFEDGFYPETLIGLINERFPAGLMVTDVYSLITPYKRAPSLVFWAKYHIWGIDGISEELIDSFMARDVININKKTKRKTELTDIMPDIYSVCKVEYGMSAILACGSVRNLKAALFAEAFFDYTGISAPLYKVCIERKEIFGVSEEEAGEGASIGRQVLLPLSKMYVYTESFGGDSR